MVTRRQYRSDVLRGSTWPGIRINQKQSCIVLTTVRQARMCRRAAQREHNILTEWGKEVAACNRQTAEVQAAIVRESTHRQHIEQVTREEAEAFDRLNASMRGEASDLRAELQKLPGGDVAIERARAAAAAATAAAIARLATARMASDGSAAAKAMVAASVGSGTLAPPALPDGSFSVTGSGGAETSDGCLGNTSRVTSSGPVFDTSDCSRSGDPAAASALPSELSCRSSRVATNDKSEHSSISNQAHCSGGVDALRVDNQSINGLERSIAAGANSVGHRPSGRGLTDSPTRPVGSATHPGPSTHPVGGSVRDRVSRVPARRRITKPVRQGYDTWSRGKPDMDTSPRW
eukprot:TRINITY_DN45378_c0_g1_i1.p1 TRINITY_DN45378_c0_g1~~TRINITY_DN45378_c0_g1_i1.p1  ORF type:complete len:348 (+),score=27.43 TRINITY_DN45378_c0_g1_i1:82-1125(+)